MTEVPRWRRWLPYLEVPAILLVFTTLALSSGLAPYHHMLTTVKDLSKLFQADYPWISFGPLLRETQKMPAALPLVVALLVVRWVRHRPSAVTGAAVAILGGGLLLFWWSG